MCFEGTWRNTGVIAPHGPANVRLLAAALNDADSSLQSLVRDIGAVYLE